MPFSNRQKALIIVFLCLLSAFGGRCSGALVTVSISGWVTSVEDSAGAFGGEIFVGEEITGFYKYDSAALDSNPSNTIGDYKYDTSPFGISLNIGEMLFASNPQSVDFLIEVRNDDNQKDGYLITSSSNLPLSNGAGINQILWQLEYDNLAAINSDALTVSAPILQGLQSNILRITSGRASIRGEIDYAQSDIVPEPATMLLMGFGVMAHRRRRRGN
jgi:hypothetical protein